MKTWIDYLGTSDVKVASSGMDAFLTDAPTLVERLKLPHNEFPVSNIKIASVGDLAGFARVSSNTLVRLAERDLWSIEEDDDGEIVISRLFKDDGNPLKLKV